MHKENFQCRAFLAKSYPSLVIFHCAFGCILPVFFNHIHLSAHLPTFVVLLQELSAPIDQQHKLIVIRWNLTEGSLVKSTQEVPAFLAV